MPAADDEHTALAGALAETLDTEKERVGSDG